ncbi:response regulator [Paenibacillus alkalitolerans]|uniref:response regulator n=1 Tax=Paenibacillus alkalitolerans TaxID=2799335 RepID=UPI0018F53D07|nr:response regulator [Paenibacillus alkalitolerans]
MYKVLLADDEKFILQGVSALVEWEQIGTRLIGTALDGEEALEMIRNEPPDIVISDIKMPGMNGLELIQAVRTAYPEIRFIILSGYEEFEFAKKAMEFGVKHYLLKPCNERKIAEVLSNVIEEMEETRKKESFIQKTRYNLEKVMPKVKEQFLKECLTNKTYGKKEWDYYSQLLNLQISEELVKLLLFEIEGAYDVEHIFALKNISAELAGEHNKVLLSTTIGERVVILIENPRMDNLSHQLKQIKKVYKNYYGLEVTIAVSDSGKISNLRKLYKQTLECLTHRFYLGEGSIIDHQDIRTPGEHPEDVQFDHEELAISLRGGSIDKSQEYIARFFARLKREKFDIGLVKSYTLELFMIIVREAGRQNMERYLKKVAELESMTTLDHIEEFIVQSAREVAEDTYEAHSNKQSRIVKKMIEFVEENIEDESFSLNKLANEMMFMSADYLSKVFKKETGERFTIFLIGVRIAKAKELIHQMEDVRIIEIAERVGFGNNPKYFSQVFKKTTGYSVSDYKNLML